VWKLASGHIPYMCLLEQHSALHMLIMLHFDMIGHICNNNNKSIANPQATDKAGRLR